MMTPGDPITVASSRFWALFHVNLTRWIFPARMVADQIGVSTNIIEYWPVSYTHLDVYKRQPGERATRSFTAARSTRVDLLFTMSDSLRAVVQKDDSALIRFFTNECCSRRLL